MTHQATSTGLPEGEQPQAVLIERARPSRVARLLTWFVVLYTALLIAMAVWMRIDGDRRPLATLFLFGPRFLVAIPWPLLVVAAAIFRRRLLLVLAFAGLVILGPIMGLIVHGPPDTWDRGLYRIMTFNVDQTQFDPTELSLLIDDMQVDIVALQEVSSQAKLIWPKEWHVIKHDEFVLASRYEIVERDVVRRVGPPADVSVIGFTVKGPRGPLEVYNVHLETPRSGIEAVLKDERWFDSPQLEQVIKERALESRTDSEWLAKLQGPKIILGDFNTPTESAIFRQDWSNYTDAFTTSGLGFGFTKISERGGWSYGTRIDHILYTAPWICKQCWVGPDLGSDHLPLLADFDMPPY